MNQIKTPEIPFGLAVGYLRFANQQLESALLKNNSIEIINSIDNVRHHIDLVQNHSTKAEATDVSIHLWNRIYKDTIQVVDNNLKIAHLKLSSKLVVV